MTKLLLASVVVLACGCGGSSSSTSGTARFAGTWTGTWVNVKDSTDKGTSNWVIGANGAVNGTDYESGDSVTYQEVGTISSIGSFSAISTPSNAAATTLTGSFTFSSNTSFSGNLTFGGATPLVYLYTFTRQ